MNQTKIGEFIAEKRKSKKLTQAALAEKLGITDRAVSKWERGKGMPDVSIMLELCEILGVTVNELLSGEVIDMEDYNKRAEENLLKMQQQKEESDRRLLKLEVVIGYMASITFMVLIFIVSFIEMPTAVMLLLVAFACAVLFVGIANALKIEQTAGYYRCGKCGYEYVPTYKSVFWAMHLNRTRYMCCPSCKHKSWHKKVLTKENKE